MDFNASLLADYNDDAAHAALETYGDAFRYQLAAALHLSDWAERMSDPEDPIHETMDAQEIQGWINAIHHVAGYLRQGYYLPGGLHFEQVVSERQSPD